MNFSRFEMNCLGMVFSFFPWGQSLVHAETTPVDCNGEIIEEQIERLKGLVFFNNTSEEIESIFERMWEMDVEYPDAEGQVLQSNEIRKQLKDFFNGKSEALTHYRDYILDFSGKFEQTETEESVCATVMRLMSKTAEKAAQLFSHDGE